MEGTTVKRWENFSNDANRKYKAKYAKTTLKGSENVDGGKEFINEMGESEIKNKKTEEIKVNQKEDSFPTKELNSKNSRDSDLALIGFCLYY